MMNCWILVTHSHLKTRSVCLSVGDTDEGDGVRWRRRVWRAALTLSRRWLHADWLSLQGGPSAANHSVFPRSLASASSTAACNYSIWPARRASSMSERASAPPLWHRTVVRRPAQPPIVPRVVSPKVAERTAFFFSTSLVDHLLFCLILSAFLLICLDMPEWLYLSKVYRKVSSLKGLSCFFALFNWYLLMFNGLILSLTRIFLIILLFPVKSFFPFHLSTTPLTDSPFVAI